ncbi:MAG: TerB family tellurite resistance protein [Deltaproteobacteria bacterium]|nr:TerB family tellurite resistance protein [Deltaproteobacteria bacterium]
MEEITYESLQPLLLEVQQEGHDLRCLFGCPLCDFRIRAEAIVKHASLGEELSASERKQEQGAKSSLAGFLRRILGGGPLRAVGEVAKTAVSDSSPPGVYSEDEKQSAVIAAFRQVLPSFVWDGTARRWLSARAATGLLPEFNQQLVAAPISREVDRDVLARMLVEVAQADGVLAPEERGFLESFLGKEEGRLDDLTKQPLLSRDELAACGALEVRETMLMLAWATSLVDGDLDPRETARLKELARGLSVRGGRAETLKRYAQVFLVDQALEHAYGGAAGGARRHAEAFALAKRLGLDQASVERVDIRLRRRLGRV